MLGDVVGEQGFMSPRLHRLDNLHPISDLYRGRCRVTYRLGSSYQGSPSAPVMHSQFLEQSEDPQWADPTNRLPARPGEAKTQAPRPS